MDRQAKNNKQENEWDVIVVGSGPGGLAAAVALSNFNKRVLVLEQHYLPGGWTHTFALEGHKFSPGVHYIGQLQDGGNTRNILEGLGVGGDIEFNELNPDGYDHIVFTDEVFDIPSGRNQFVQRLIERFPDEQKGIQNYFRLMQKVDHGLTMAKDATGFRGILRLLLKAPSIALHGMKPTEQVVDRFIKDRKLKAILLARSGDHGMAPSRVPFALHVAIEAHYWNGAWYPKGGGGAIPRAFINRLKQNGGQIQTRTRVEKILTEETGNRRQATGVQLESGTVIHAPHVISNADAWVTYRRLIGQENLSAKLASRIGQLEPSVSALSLFIATDLDIDALQLDSGNYWLLHEQDVEATYAFAESDLLEGSEIFPGAFLTVTSRKDPEKLKDGIHTMEAFTFVSANAFDKWRNSHPDQRPAEYTRFKEHLTDRMLATIERIVPEIRDHLMLCELGTPLTNDFYVNVHRGNCYGTAKSRQQIGPSALPVRTEIENLFHCGQSTAAHGVLGAMTTGVMAATQLLNREQAEVLGFENGRVKLHSV